jgi:hypothetical protein
LQELGVISVQELVPGGYLILLIPVCSGLVLKFWNIIYNQRIANWTGFSESKTESEDDQYWLQLFTKKNLK